MNIEEYEKMYHLEDTYWWFQGRRAIIQDILKTFMRRPPRPGRVLDVCSAVHVMYVMYVCHTMYVCS